MKKGGKSVNYPVVQQYMFMSLRQKCIDTINTSGLNESLSFASSHVKEKSRFQIQFSII